jgi:hypothetical protein
MRTQNKLSRKEVVFLTAVRPLGVSLLAAVGLFAFPRNSLAQSAADAGRPPVPEPTTERDSTMAFPGPPSARAGLDIEGFRLLNRPRYHNAIARARKWLDETEADPIELRAKGLKGKKSMTMLLDTYMRLHDVATTGEKARILERLRGIARVTYTTAYHDMLTTDDKAFKQDATSYLRAAYLMDRLGLDTTLYRKEIRKAHARLNSHMRARGVHQRMAFHWYYEHFGLEEPFLLARAYYRGIIATRRGPETFSRMDGYHLTHEIFVPCRFGETLPGDFFSAEDRTYLRSTLERLTMEYIERDDPDLTAEFASCMAYLEFTDSPVFIQSVEYLLTVQNTDGSWGGYEQFRDRLGDYVRQHLYLHTVGVAVDALISAFEGVGIKAGMHGQEGG